MTSIGAKINAGIAALRDNRPVAVDIAKQLADHAAGDPTNPENQAIGRQLSAIATQLGARLPRPGSTAGTPSLSNEARKQLTRHLADIWEAGDNALLLPGQASLEAAVPVAPKEPTRRAAWTRLVALQTAALAEKTRMQSEDQKTDRNPATNLPFVSAARTFIREKNNYLTKPDAVAPPPAAATDYSQLESQLTQIWAKGDAALLLPGQASSTEPVPPAPRDPARTDAWTRLVALQQAAIEAQTRIQPRTQTTDRNPATNLQFVSAAKRFIDAKSVYESYTSPFNPFSPSFSNPVRAADAPAGSGIREAIDETVGVEDRVATARAGARRRAAEEAAAATAATVTASGFNTIERAQDEASRVEAIKNYIRTTRNPNWQGLNAQIIKHRREVRGTPLEETYNQLSKNVLERLTAAALNPTNMSARRARATKTRMAQLLGYNNARNMDEDDKQRTQVGLIIDNPNTTPETLEAYKDIIRQKLANFDGKEAHKSWDRLATKMAARGITNDAASLNALTTVGGSRRSRKHRHKRRITQKRSV